MAGAVSNNEVHNLAFEGGSLRGITYIGTLQALRDLNQLSKVKKTIGSSAGSLSALGVAFNYSPDDLQQFMMDMKADNILDLNYLKLFSNIIKKPSDIFTHLEAFAEAFGKSLHTTIKSITELPDEGQNIGRGLFLKKFALFKGANAYESIHQFIRKGLEKAIQTHPEIAHLFAQGQDPATITFKQLHDLAVKYPDLHFADELIITAFNVTSKKVVNFNYKTHPDMEIALAARASMAIPMLLEPVKYKGESYIDGGVAKNFPIDEFDINGEVNRHTLGIRVDTAKEMENLFWQAPSNRPQFSFLGSMLNFITGTNYTAANHNSARAAYERDGFRTLQIPDLNVKMLDFDLSNEKKKELIDTAYITTLAWHFLYREETIKNLNLNNIHRLDECLKNLRTQYQQDIKKSSSNKTLFATNYEICMGIYQKVMNPSPLSRKQDKILENKTDIQRSHSILND